MNSRCFSEMARGETGSSHPETRGLKCRDRDLNPGQQIGRLWPRAGDQCSGGRRIFRRLAFNGSPDSFRSLPLSGGLAVKSWLR